MLGVDVNLLAVLIAAVASTIIGALWYGPVFGKAWMRMMNLSKSSLKEMSLSPGSAMVLGFIASLVTAYILGVFMGLTDSTTIGKGVVTAFWIWLGFAMPIHAGVFLWEGKPFNLFLFNTASYLISILVMGMILTIG